MRVIKFRGKRIDDPNQWEYGYALVDDTDVWIHTLDGRVLRVIPETVGQFTCLHDKNGKEIYEGDILTWRSIICEEDPVETWELPVTFYNGCFCLNDDFDMTLISVIYDSEEFGGVKIIGNIHDNKLEDIK